MKEKHYSIKELKDLFSFNQYQLWYIADTMKERFTAEWLLEELLRSLDIDQMNESLSDIARIWDIEFTEEDFNELNKENKLIVGI